MMTTRKNQSMCEHQQGVDAAWAGKTEDDCPEELTSEKRKWWLIGFSLGLSCLLRTRSWDKMEDDS